MHVASLELCKRLYELSGWSDTNCRWRLKHRKDKNPDLALVPYQYRRGEFYPAYSLSYLLRKLPTNIPNEHNGGSYWLNLCFGDSQMWHASYDNALGEFVHDTHDDTPEDAAAKLCIELIKQGVLKP